MAKTYTIAEVITKLCDRDIFFTDPDVPTGFLERQIIRETQRNPEFDIDFQTPKGVPIFFEHLTDLTHLLEYLIGNIPIIAGTTSDSFKRRIYEINDMRMLKPEEIGVTNQEYRTDMRLYELNKSINNRAHNYPTLRWGNSIDEVGDDESVIRNCGQPLTYMMVLKSPKLIVPTKQSSRRSKNKQTRKPKFILPKPNWGDEPSTESGRIVREYYEDVYKSLEKDIPTEKDKDRKPYK